jgi:hypothetical protein
VEVSRILQGTQQKTKQERIMKKMKKIMIAVMAVMIPAAAMAGLEVLDNAADNAAIAVSGSADVARQQGGVSFDGNLVYEGASAVEVGALEFEAAPELAVAEPVKAAEVSVPELEGSVQSYEGAEAGAVVGVIAGLAGAVWGSIAVGLAVGGGWGVVAGLATFYLGTRLAMFLGAIIGAAIGLLF